MDLVALTGGIASGKSIVAQQLATNGLAVASADQFSRDVVAAGTDGLRQVVEKFGESVLQGDGNLDRSGLRNLIFSDPAARASLEQILHPQIRAATDAWCQQQQDDGARFAVLEIPLLVETGQQNNMARVIVVDVPVPLQIERVASRDGSSVSDAKNIIASQASREERLAAATDVIVNDTTLAAVRADAVALAERLQTLHG